MGEETPPDGSAWFGPAQQDALRDFRAVYEANHVASDGAARSQIERGSVAPPPSGAGDGPPVVERPGDEVLHRAMAGDWAGFEAALRVQGRRYAKAQAPFSLWSKAGRAFCHELLPRLVKAYRDEPDRLAAALEVMHEIVDRSTAIVGGEYLATREADQAAAEEARCASEERYRLLFEESPLPMWAFDEETLRFMAVNDAAVKHYGYTRDEFLQMTVKDIRPAEDLAALVEQLALPPAQRDERTWRHRKKDGTLVYVEAPAQCVTFTGRPARLVVVRDVTERVRAELSATEAAAALRRTEAQLQSAQKMEAIGTLAGGIAHDFNNLLSVILGLTDLLAQDLDLADPMRGDILEIRAAGQRAAELTRQLLAFGRRQILAPRTTDLGTIVGGFERLLRRVLGEDIELTLVTTSAAKILVDRGQIEQVIMNLVVNARDAMPGGGKLTLEIGETHLDESYAADHAGVTPGPHAMLAVSDTGTGMDAATLSRIFEPFFTTKEVGKGTGLGLAMAFGIVKQSGGHIWVYSEPGVGTTFKLFFPITERAERMSEAAVASPKEALEGSETILLVEDDESVRRMTRSILKRYGYNVLEALTGGDALLLCEQHTATIHLMLTDVVMPRMSGRQLAERLRPLRPDMSVLFMSGYTTDSVVLHGILDSDVAFLQKPVTPGALARKVREVLDEAAARGEARRRPEA